MDNKVVRSFIDGDRSIVKDDTKLNDVNFKAKQVVVPNQQRQVVANKQPNVNAQQRVNNSSAPIKNPKYTYLNSLSMHDLLVESKPYPYTKHTSINLNSLVNLLTYGNVKTAVTVMVPIQQEEVKPEIKQRVAETTNDITYDSFDLSDIFSEETSDEVVHEEVSDEVVTEETIENKNEIKLTQVNLMEDINMFIEEVDDTNVFDFDNNPLSKDEFISEYINHNPQIYDIVGNIIDKETIRRMIENDSVVVYDSAKNRVIKLYLVKEINSAIIAKQKAETVYSNVYNEFNKPVMKDELLKEYNTKKPNLFDKDGNRLSTECIIADIESGELVIAEYGFKLDKDELVKELKDNKTSVYDRYENILDKDKLTIYIKNKDDLYDKYQNQLTREDILVKVNSNLLLVKDTNDNLLKKKELLEDVLGYVDVYNSSKERLTKSDLESYVATNNVSLYDSNKKLLTGKQVLNVLEKYNINYTYGYEKKLTGEKSNIFSEYGDPLTFNELVMEYRNVLPRLFDKDSKKIEKTNLIDLIESGSLFIIENGIKVDSNVLVKELKVNVLGLFSFEKEELTKEELLSEIQQKNTVYNFKGKALTMDILINNIRHGINVVYDMYGDIVSASELLIDFEKEYLFIFDFYQNPLSKEDIIEQLNNGNKKLYNETRQLLSDDQLRKFLIENNIPITDYIEFLLMDKQFEAEREFININDEVSDEVLCKEETYKDVVLARKELNGFSLITYNESFEARLNLTDDIVKDFYNTLKNKFLSYEKVKSKITWDNESLLLGKKVIAKIDIQVNTLYLYLVTFDFEFNFKYKDCSDKKEFASTPYRLTISSLFELKNAYQLIETIANKNKAKLNVGYNMFNYYEKNRGFDNLLKQSLIKEIVTSKSESDLSIINKSVVDSNRITSIDKDIVKEMKIENEYYLFILSKISSEPNKEVMDIVHLDTISRAFVDNDIISLETLKKKSLISEATTFVKCIARGTLDKSLVFELNDYSKDSVKMIMLTNGTIQ